MIQEVVKFADLAIREVGETESVYDCAKRGGKTFDLHGTGPVADQCSCLQSWARQQR